MDRQVLGLRQRFAANRFASTMVILATLSLGILIGTVVSGAVKGKEQNCFVRCDAAEVPSPAQMSNQFSTIARQLEPSVVNINTESTIKNPHRRRAWPGGQGQQDDTGGGDRRQSLPGLLQPLLWRTRRARWIRRPGGGDMRERSLGSGVIVDCKGYILTNTSRGG